jgi:hypothetical protein
MPRAVKKTSPTPVAEIRVTIGNHVARLWPTQRSAIQAANLLTRSHQFQHRAARYRDWWFVQSADEKTFFDNAGKMPEEMRNFILHERHRPAIRDVWRADTTFMKEQAVYPGHPVTIAFCIVNAFETYEEAFAPTPHNFAEALGSCAIPGAGGCVSSALHLLSHLRQGLDTTKALEIADDTWARTDSQKEQYSERWAKGQEQADRFKAKLLERSDWWRAP